MSENTTPTETTEAPVEETPRKRRFPRPSRSMLIAGVASFTAGALSVLAIKRAKDDEDDAGVDLTIEPNGEVEETFKS